MSPYKERQLIGRRIKTIAQLENLHLEDLSEVPSEKQVRGSIKPIVQAYLELQLKKGRLGKITELQLFCVIKEIMERVNAEKEYRKRTLKEILEELRSKSGKGNGVMVGNE